MSFLNYSSKFVYSILDYVYTYVRRLSSIQYLNVPASLYPVVGVLISCIALPCLKIEIGSRIASCYVMSCFDNQLQKKILYSCFALITNCIKENCTLC